MELFDYLICSLFGDEGEWCWANLTHSRYAYYNFVQMKLVNNKSRPIATFKIQIDRFDCKTGEKTAY